MYRDCLQRLTPTQPSVIPRSTATRNLGFLPPREEPISLALLGTTITGLLAFPQPPTKSSKSTSLPSSATRANRASVHRPTHPTNAELPSGAAPQRASHFDRDKYPSAPIPRQSASGDTC